jgi:uncharacterized protein YhhL (DUF1145 family)
MAYAFLTLFAVIAAGIFGGTILMSASHYRALPPEVADHFDGYGWPDAFGPRPMIFVLVFAQAVLLGLWAWILVNVVHEIAAIRVIVISGVIVDVVLFILYRLQRESIAVAEGRAERVGSPLATLGVIAATIAVALIFGLLLH